jgi:DNA-binding NarL/FixJ family response regulator
MSISVAIVDDNPEIRRNLRRYIGEAPGFRYTCAHASGEEALRLLPQPPPDVEFIDIQMLGLNGIACTAALKRVLPLVPVMMLTVYEDDDAIFNALKVGASGYALNEDKPPRASPLWGYESSRAMQVLGLPAFRWADDVEDRITAGTRRLVKEVSTL